MAAVSIKTSISPLAPPQLKGVVPDLAERYIRSIQQAHAALQSSFSSMEATMATLQTDFTTQTGSIAAGLKDIVAAITAAGKASAAATTTAPLAVALTPTPTTPATGVPVTNQGSPGAVNTVPPTTPVVNVLPGLSDPLSVINQIIIIPSGLPGVAGTPYTFTAPLTGAGAGWWRLSLTVSPSISDTFANLSLYPAANYSVGAMFYATDKNISYTVQIPSPANVATWVYYNGIYEDTLANIPAGLGTNSRGLVFRASDYLHNWEWTGTVWSLYYAMQMGNSAGYPPGTVLYSGSAPFGGSGQLWQACNGSTVNVSQEDATLASTVMPTITNGWYAR